jgi:NTP pyrophosphatase (non-canonical NTP hydrolase)
MTEIETKLGFDKLADSLHRTAIDKGFWDNDADDETFCTKIALIHSEATEVLEAIRKNQGAEAIAEEIADIIIRTLDLYAALYRYGRTRHSLDDVIQLKMSKNKDRPHKHGNRF